MTDAIAMAERRRESPGATVLNGLRLAALALGRRAAAAYIQARTQRILSRLDDAALKDIGLVRSQIDGIEIDPRYTRFTRF